MALSPQQLAIRMSGVGSSDIPAVCDLLPKAWKNRRGPDDAFAEKMGDVPPFDGNVATERGDIMEPVIAGVFSQQTGRLAVRNPDTIWHPDISWAFATPDYLLEDGTGEILECKYVGFRSASYWKDGPPDYVQAQVQWQLGCLRRTRASVAAWIEGDKEHVTRAYALNFDPQLFGQLVTIADAFWRRVLEARAQRAA